MKRISRNPLIHCCLLSAAALASLPGGATGDAPDAPPALPAWQVLEYEQQAFLVTARSRVELGPHSEDGGRWQLKADSSVANNAEAVVLDLAPADGRALYRSRFSRGKQQRYKTYVFRPRDILRVRHDPPPKTTLPPAEWPVSSRRKIPYPDAASGLVVTDAYALLDLAGRFLDSPETSTELAVNTEFNFYRVVMSHSDGPAIAMNYQLQDAAAPVSGTRQTRGVTLRVSPLGELAEKPDFSLLGLDGIGDITVLFDTANNLPVQLRGTAPRIGSAEINLKAATLREATE
ncbi:MAG: hypothetical protein V2I26_12940 [Halieaceae bacterium]|jgi:hypothetical protein|nr:hypothetical protein [Halieaceae bacterium]